MVTRSKLMPMSVYASRLKNWLAGVSKFCHVTCRSSEFLL